MKFGAEQEYQVNIIVSYDEIVPDFVILGKILWLYPNKLVGPSDFESLVKKTSERIEMSCTFQAHSLAVAAALEVQKIITEDGFIEEVFKKGEYIRNALQDRVGAHHFVKNIRGRGVRNSIEYDCKNVALFSNELSNQLLKEFSIIISSKWHRTSFSHSMNLS